MVVLYDLNGESDLFLSFCIILLAPPGLGEFALVLDFLSYDVISIAVGIA